MILLLGAASSVRAQFGATAEVERPLPAASEEDPTASATVVELDEDRARALETTSEALSEVPATRARQTGDLGSFAGLSIRGADLDHTTVLFGDLPLGPADGGAFDLSTIPISLLERIEVYRGGAPLLVGGRGIGGVVRLVPRAAEGTRAEGAVGVGSFGRRQARATASVAGESGRPAVTALVGWRHTDGDYPYENDGRTPFNPDDDVVLRRQNGQLDEAFGLVHGQLELFGGELQLLGMGFGRTGGLTGSPREEPTRTHRQLVRGLGGLSWERRFDDAAHPWRLRVAFSAGHERNRLTDRLGEITRVPRATDDGSRRLFTRADADVELADWVTVAALATHAADRFDPEDALASVDETSVRHTGTLGLEGRFRAEVGKVRGELRASAGMQVSDVRLVDIGRFRTGEHTDRTTVTPDLRLGLVIEPIRGLALTGSVASAARQPTRTELFGDRAFILGDPRLDPERALQVDGGVLWEGQAGELIGTVEARVFGLFVDDLIQFVRNAQMQVRPVNVAGATVVGAEAGVRGRWDRHLALVGSLTWMHTNNRAEDGRALPLRPSLQAHLRPEVTVEGAGPVTDVTLYADLTHVAANFVDPRNLVQVPGRTLLGAGVAFEMFEGRARLAASVRDIFDTRPVDLIGFPLPGRTFSAELTVRTEANP